MRVTNFVLEETITALLEGKKYAALRDILITMNAADVASLFESLQQEKLPLLFRLLPKELAARNVCRNGNGCPGTFDSGFFRQRTERSC